MNRPPPWVKMRQQPTGKGPLDPLRIFHTCERCGAEIEIVFPLLPIEWERQAGEFGEQHRNCKVKHR